jgi:SAM-dependent methyltransferase
METGTPSSAEVRETQQRHWTSVAVAWPRWFDWTGRNFAPLTMVLRERIGWESGAAMLDIGCGSGYPALAAAGAVRPSGRVTANDVSPKMLTVTAARAAADGRFHAAVAATHVCTCIGAERKRIVMWLCKRRRRWIERSMRCRTARGVRSFVC